MFVQADARDSRAQIYNAAGNPVGTEPIVDNSYDDESDPVVSMDSQGNFVVAWTRTYAGGNADVLARRFSASGVAWPGWAAPRSVMLLLLRDKSSWVSVSPAPPSERNKPAV